MHNFPSGTELSHKFISNFNSNITVKTSRDNSSQLPFATCSLFISLYISCMLFQTIPEFPLHDFRYLYEKGYTFHTADSCAETNTIIENSLQSV